MRFKITFPILLFALSIFLNACVFNSSRQKDSTERLVAANDSSNKSVSNSTVNISNSQKNSAESSPNDTASAADLPCYNLRRENMKLLKAQTFAIDFEPFKKSCFVTFYGAEFSNPPLGSEYYIYKNGKEVFNFPDQFNGGNVLCWVTGVTFEDLNEDDLKDIIIAGKCGAKSEAYNENMVYINDGEGFETNKDSNVELMDFSKVSEIKQYVQEHESMFSK